MTPSELQYFKVLQDKYGKDHYVIPQVVLSSIVDVDLPRTRRFYYAYKGYRSRIDKKTIDFVIFDKINFTPVLAIELDDPSHELLKRKERDAFVNGVTERVGLRIVHIKTAYSYDLEEALNSIVVDN